MKSRSWVALRLVVLPLRAQAVMLAVAVLLWAGAALAESARVSIDNFTFTPSILEVEPGTTVIWSNADDIPHVVMATGKAFRSKPLDTNDRFSFTFTTPGAYDYFCSLHPHMTGKIVVKAP